MFVPAKCCNPNAPSSIALDMDLAFYASGDCSGAPSATCSGLTATLSGGFYQSFMGCPSPNTASADICCIYEGSVNEICNGYDPGYNPIYVTIYSTSPKGLRAKGECSWVVVLAFSGNYEAVPTATLSNSESPTGTYTPADCGVFAAGTSVAITRLVVA